MTQTLQPRYALAHVDAAGAHLDIFGGGRDSTQQRHRGRGLQREVVDSEGRVVHADFVRSLGDLQTSLGDLFRRWPALAVMSRDVVESVEGYAANRRVVSVVVVEVEPAGQRQASFGL